MLRLNQHSSPSAAKTYYQPMVSSVLSGYYLADKQHTPESPNVAIGKVDGKLADRLNLTGGMTEEQFHDLIDGLAVDPSTGERLRKRQNREGKNRVGLDLTFDPGGKSLSVYYAGTQDPLIPKLFEEARHETMVYDVEPRMMVRVRQNGANHSRLTGNALWTSFPDLVTRPTKVKNASGKWVETLTVDPHIHDHNYIFQYSWDAEHVNRDGSKGAYLSADTSKIFSSMPYIQKAFHARLFKKLRDHGFNVVQTEHGIELAGWNNQLSKLYSRRKEEIEAWAESKGIERADLKDRVGKLTRSGKVAGKLSPVEQFAEWRDRLPDSQWDDFIRAATQNQSDNQTSIELSMDQAIDFALAHCLERDNSATIEEVLTAALDVGMGLDVEQLKAQLMARPDVVAAWFGNDLLVTTQEMAHLQQQVLDRATRSQAACLPLGNRDFEFQPVALENGQQFTLNADQRKNLQKLLASTSRITTLRGAPGVGKTAALGTQLFRAIEENGGTVITLGATSNARDQLIEFGHQSGSQSMQASVTLASFLDNAQTQCTLGPDCLVVLDEATLAGLEDIEELTRIVESQHARLLLVGDYRQLDAVQSHAKIFQQLCQIGGHAEFSEIVRQRDPDYRRAAMLTSSGSDREVQSGFDKLVELGFVKQVDSRKDRLDQAAELYLDITGEKKSRRGKEIAWTNEQKQDPINYRSGMTVVANGGKSPVTLEVIGRQAGHVMVVNPKTSTAPYSLDLSDVSKLRVFEPNYQDAILLVGTHKDGEAVSAKIRDARRRLGELGYEITTDRLESLGLSKAQREQAQYYQPGEQIVEFSKKAKTVVRQDGKLTARTIHPGERFTVSERDASGKVWLQAASGESLELALNNAMRFDVYRQRPAKLAVGDRIRMTKGGHTLSDKFGQKGIRFSNNDVFTVQGFDQDNNPILSNGHRLAKDWSHWRSGYYKTTMAGQGSTSSHNIFVDSAAAGRARSRESWLVSVTRGKHAATILTDDIGGLRNMAILRTSQRPSGMEVVERAQQSGKRTLEAHTLPATPQATRLQKVEVLARLAAEATWQAIRRNGEYLWDKARQMLPTPLRHIEKPA
ncbi:MAG: relaxase domain-containing protein [Planctomycetales bacterium]|nr:relaxase domain-containing protein [Planctomycetales bacterium]